MINNNENIYLEAIKGLPDCDWVTDLFDMVIVWASPKMLGILGYSLDEILGTPVLSYIEKRKDDATLRREMVEMITKGNGEYEYFVETKSKEVIRLPFAYYAFEIGGNKYFAGKVLKIEPSV